MKNLIKYQFLVLSILILGLQLSCKKDSALKVDNSYEVEYGISPATNAITRITYTDASGTPVVLNDVSQFPNGKKAIRVSSKPFTAKISVDINNQNTVFFDCIITISVNGELKQSYGIHVPSMSSSNGVATAEYVVQ